MWGSIRGKAHPLPRNAQSNGQHFSGAMERYTVGSIRRKAHPLPHNTHSNGQHTSGAMEEMSGKVQNASTGPGRWIQVQGKGRRRAYVISRVVMDIAAFKLSHSIGCDRDATALRAARARSSSIGAMDESSGKVQM